MVFSGVTGGGIDDDDDDDDDNKELVRKTAFQ